MKVYQNQNALTMTFHYNKLITFRLLSFSIFFIYIYIYIYILLTYYVYIYIYILLTIDINIYIITVSVVTKSLCGFVLNQMQYNMKSAQYLG